MSGPISAEIERARRADEAAIFLRHEKAMADRLVTTGRTPLSDGDKALLVLFVQWCGQKRVRHCPARPAAVATFIMERAAQGAETILKIVRAIELLHDFHGFANPVATHAVHVALDPIVNVEAPRSWPAGDKVRFKNLPPDMQAVIARREREREKEIRRLQNETAAIRNANTKGSDDMTKKPGWNKKGQGPYWSDDAGITHEKPVITDIENRNANKDISGIVDRNADTENGALRSSKAS